MHGYYVTPTNWHIASNKWDIVMCTVFSEREGVCVSKTDRQTDRQRGVIGFLSKIICSSFTQVPTTIWCRLNTGPMRASNDPVLSQHQIWCSEVLPFSTIVLASSFSNRLSCEQACHNVSPKIQCAIWAPHKILPILHHCKWFVNTPKSPKIILCGLQDYKYQNEWSSRK